MAQSLETLKHQQRMELNSNHKKYIDLNQASARLARRKLTNKVAQVLFSTTIVFFIIMCPCPSLIQHSVSQYRMA